MLKTFDFEQAFVDTLRCIPMGVRFKLDRCAIKLTLRQWSRFTEDDRRGLLEAPCGAPEEVEAYRLAVIQLVAERAQELADNLADPPLEIWEPLDRVPERVQAFARQVGVEPPGRQQWASLSELHRYALVKLTRDSHDNLNFVPALREFGLLPETPQRAMA